MSSIIIGHTMLPGHRCYNPFKQIKAANLRAGERIYYGKWQLWAQHFSGGEVMYRIDKINGPSDVYEFSNVSCAGAKLAEIGYSE